MYDARVDRLHDNLARVARITATAHRFSLTLLDQRYCARHNFYLSSGGSIIRAGHELPRDLSGQF